ncbi:MAG: hypothetical protein RJQ14_05385, partial [Marinoscillum sp.]
MPSSLNKILCLFQSKKLIILLVITFYTNKVDCQSQYWECEYLVSGRDTSGFNNQVSVEFLELQNSINSKSVRVTFPVDVSSSSRFGHVKIVGKLPGTADLDTNEDYVEHTYIAGELIRSRYFLKRRILDRKLLLNGIDSANILRDTSERLFIPHDIEVIRHSGIELNGLIFNSLKIFGRYDQSSTTTGSIDISNCFLRECHITADQNNGYLNLRSSSILKGNLSAKNLDEISLIENYIFGLGIEAAGTRKVFIY